jgi:hypothetical protein
MILPGTYVRCMSGHYYAETRGDEECPICEELTRLRAFLGAETRTELARQMRDRASFAGTSASLKRLLETWADVIVGAPGVGGLAANRADLEWDKELAQSRGDATHQWEPHRNGEKWQYCRICGIIRRADRLNSPCKGPTRMREMESAV